MELDNAEYENTQIQEEINALYDIFTREIAAQKLLKTCCQLFLHILKHLKDNNQVLVKDIATLEQNYLMSESDEIMSVVFKLDLDSLEYNQ